MAALTDTDRLRELHDIEAIKKLKACYIEAFDGGRSLEPDRRHVRRRIPSNRRRLAYPFTTALTKTYSEPWEFK